MWERPSGGSESVSRVPGIEGIPNWNRPFPKKLLQSKVELEEVGYHYSSTAIDSNITYLMANRPCKALSIRRDAWS